ncbi:MAG: phosphopantetheine-binding protein [Oscillospiraceae bacterium]|jgi:acyl carrier protein|nr:phosphopantetheine-binding protein [Oscillospiraceae bacterium]
MALDKLRMILAVQMGADPDMIKLDTDIVNDLGADSLDIAELLMSIESEFGVLLTEEMVAEVHTIRELIALIGKG